MTYKSKLTLTKKEADNFNKCKYTDGEIKIKFENGNTIQLDMFNKNEKTQHKWKYQLYYNISMLNDKGKHLEYLSTTEKIEDVASSYCYNKDEYVIELLIKAS